MNPIDWVNRVLRGQRPRARGTHQIIANDSGEYVVWPTTHSLPPSWRSVGEPGSEEAMQFEVLKFIAETSPAPLLVKSAPKTKR